jgi:hypothetical protein
MAVQGRLHRLSCFSRSRESESAQEIFEEGAMTFLEDKESSALSKSACF